ncbi:hypothetical protein Bca52824_032930 [Brassica carinata]|uniref:Uncharacterized protein n=1 Tax=Brassica carinata TaxID=52824 RepID=A0A8X7SBY3_BRACI|nr:hypothetical protein Bca52824_032930 [Brassica carinata]
MGKEIDAIANLAFSSSSSHRQAKAGGRGLVEEELVLCRGDVSNSPRLDSFDCCSLSLECQEHPLKVL